MHDQLAMQMMQRCKEEIATLREQVACLKPKAEAYDAITRILGLLPRQSEGAREDILWRLDKGIEELQEAMKPAKPTGVRAAAEAVLHEVRDREGYFGKDDAQ